MKKGKQKTEVVLAESGQQALPIPKKKKWQNIWRLGAVLSLAGAIVILTHYLNISELHPSEPSISDLYNVGNCTGYNYVLYRDLYNVVNGSHMSFDQLYGMSDGEGQELDLSSALVEQGQALLMDASEYDGTEEKIRQLWEWVMDRSLYNVYACLDEYLDSLSQDMQGKMGVLDYWMQDHKSGTIVTNTLQTEKGQDFLTQEYAVWFRMDYDAAGNFSVKAVMDNDANTLIKSLYDSVRKGLYGICIREGNLRSYVPENIEMAEYEYGYVGIAALDSSFMSQLEQRARSYGGPKDCTVVYGIKNSQWETMAGNYRAEVDYTDVYREYEYNGLGSVFLTIAAALLAWGFFYGNPRREEKRLLRHFRRAPAEAMAVGIAMFPGLHEMVSHWAALLYMNNNPGYYLRTVYWWTWGDRLAYGVNLLVVAGLFFAAWYMGCCLGEMRRLGVRGYLHKRMLCVQIWNWCRERVRRYYRTLVNLDITRDSRRQVIKLLLINGIVVLLLCTMWVAGWFGVIIYSLLLYFVVKKYISDIQKKYSILLRATNEIADGNLEVRITEHLGVFEPFKPQIYRIEEGFQKAVAEEVKSQRMKTELITNVSHDLKTPLTAIITYVNLLKEENVTEEQRTQYLQILEQKSLRLKALIEDLFEVSKANSRNVTLNLVDVDIVNLLRQVEFEQEDRLEERNLAVRLRLPEEKVIVRLDSQKAYRIYENLFGNIIKYALEGTRIYVDLERSEKEVTVRLKNITEQEITVSAEELTERFVRGDASRGTEGSGLGLAIVRSFTELMGGRFSVTVDGDLFTASTTWVLEQN